MKKSKNNARTTLPNTNMHALTCRKIYKNDATLNDITKIRDLARKYKLRSPMSRTPWQLCEALSKSDLTIGGKSVRKPVRKTTKYTTAALPALAYWHLQGRHRLQPLSGAIAHTPLIYRTVKNTHKIAKRRLGLKKPNRRQYVYKQEIVPAILRKNDA